MPLKVKRTSVKVEVSSPKLERILEHQESCTHCYFPATRLTCEVRDILIEEDLPMGAASEVL